MIVELKIWKTCLEFYLNRSMSCGWCECNNNIRCCKWRWKTINIRRNFVLKRSISHYPFEHIIGCNFLILFEDKKFVLRDITLRSKWAYFWCTNETLYYLWSLKIIYFLYYIYSMMDSITIELKNLFAS